MDTLVDNPRPKWDKLQATLLFSFEISFHCSINWTPLYFTFRLSEFKQREIRTMFYGEPKVHKVNIHHWAFWFNGLRTSSGNQIPNHLFWGLPLAADQCWSLWSAVTNGSEGCNSLAQLAELSKWQVYRKGADSDRELYSLYSTYSPFWGQLIILV